jgi:hypothetical protein
MSHKILIVLEVHCGQNGHIRAVHLDYMRAFMSLGKLLSLIIFFVFSLFLSFASSD